MPRDTSNRADAAVPTPSYSHQDVVDGEEGILPGARVRDAEDDEGDEMVVLKMMRQTVSEVFKDGQAISEVGVNKDYPDDDTAVVCAFTETLDREMGGIWRGRDRARLHERVVDAGVDTYTYPESRLTTMSEYEVVLKPDKLPNTDEESVVGKFDTEAEAEERVKEHSEHMDLLTSDYEVRRVGQ